MSLKYTSDLNELLNVASDYIKTGFRSDNAVKNTDCENPDGWHRENELQNTAAEIKACTKCPLQKERNNAVPGTGVIDPHIMIIGEGPGSQEDKMSLPFVGKAGGYLDKWLQAIDLHRNTDCFITNIVKCRPPGDRDPEPLEQDICMAYLDKQIDVIQPRVILCLGRIAGKRLTGTDASLSAVRGRRFEYRGVEVYATYHPGAVLRNPELRKSVWDDLKSLRTRIDEILQGPV